MSHKSACLRLQLIHLMRLLKLGKLDRNARAMRFIHDLKVYCGAATIQLIGYVGGLAYFFHLVAFLYLLLVRTELCNDFDCSYGATNSHAVFVDGLPVDNDWLPPYQMRAPELKLDFTTYCFSFWWSMSVVIGPRKIRMSLVVSASAD